MVYLRSTHFRKGAHVTTRTRILSIGAVAALAACSSSGGGAPYIDIAYEGPTQTVTLDDPATAGAMVAAANAGVGSFAGSSDTSAVVGVGGAGPAVGVRAALRALQKIRRPGVAVVAGVTQRDTYPCYVSGSYTLSATMADPDGLVLTRGDAFSVAFNVCDDGFGVMAGTETVTIDACPDGAFFLDPTSATPGAVYGMTVQLFDFVQVDELGYFSGLDGDMTVSMSYAVDGDGVGGWMTSSVSGDGIAFAQGFELVATSSASLTGIDGGRYSMEEGAHFPIDLYDWPDVYRSAISARICSTEMGGAGGCLDVETTSPLLQLDGDPYPYTGTLVFSDDAGHYVRITATSGTGSVTVTYLIGAGPEATTFTTWGCLDTDTCF
jgi:hypothetical protein